MSDEKNKEIRKLELEISRLQMIIRLQEDIIDSYRELSRLKGSKLVISQWNDGVEKDVML